MKTICYSSKLFLLLLVFLFTVKNNQAQKPAPPAPPAPAAHEVKEPDYSYLKTYEEQDTKIFGTVKGEFNETFVHLYRKDSINSNNTFHLNIGAQFKLLNQKPVSGFQRILVKVISNPPSNVNVDTVGWIRITNTSLTKYYDVKRDYIDSNFLYDKFFNAATKARDDAKKTTCRANKACYTKWAEYFDCQVKYSHSDEKPNCPLVNCAIEDCPGDDTPEKSSQH